MDYLSSWDAAYCSRDLERGRFLPDEGNAPWWRFPGVTTIVPPDNVCVSDWEPIYPRCIRHKITSIPINPVISLITLHNINSAFALVLCILTATSRISKPNVSGTTGTTVNMSVLGLARIHLTSPLSIIETCVDYLRRTRELWLKRRTRIFLMTRLINTKSEWDGKMMTTGRLSLRFRVRGMTRYWLE